MHLVKPIIRPPSEAESILLQVTTGCSHNQCTFCGAYKGKRFTIKPDRIIKEDLEFAAEYYQHKRRVFLCDGDALIIPQPRLLGIIEGIEEHLPWVRRISTYASAKSIARKSDYDLTVLRQKGLRLVHMGLESGCDKTLHTMRKFGNSAFIIEQGRRVRKAGIKLFVTVLLGLGGTTNSMRHARKTGSALSQLDPDYIGTLILMVLENTPLFDEWKSHRFELPNPVMLMKELRTLVEHLQVTRCLFFSNHASNYLPIRARFPSEKNEVLRRIDAAIQGDIPLRPEWTRGL